VKIVIDTWLEQKDPCICFLDGNTAAPVMQWGAPLIRHLLERGDLNLDELQRRTDTGLDAIYAFLSAISGEMGGAHQG